MSGFHTQARDVIARVPHHCTNCGEPIGVGETYKRWTSFDDSAFTNKMHAECLTSLQSDSECGDFEYMPYSGERPVVS